MALNSMPWEENHQAVSIKSQNRAVAQWLPDRNSSFSQAVIDFVKFLLGKNDSTAYPLDPTPNELSQLPDVTFNDIINDQRVFHLPLDRASPSATPSKNLRRQKDCWATNRHLFLQDLRIFGFPRATFAWEQSDKSPWNQTFLAFVVKSFRHAMDMDSFSKYCVNPEHDSDLICMGILERWLRGRSDEAHRQSRDQNLKLKDKKKKDKARMLAYRQTTIEEVLQINPLTVLPDVGCCSDTEADGECPSRAVGMIWRSAEYAEFLHAVDKLSYKYVSSTKGSRYAATRLDRRRKPAIRLESSSRVKKGLPINFYCPIFLSKLSVTERACLTTVPALPELQTLLSDVYSKSR